MALGFVVDVAGVEEGVGGDCCGCEGQGEEGSEMVCHFASFLFEKGMSVVLVLIDE